MTMTFFNHIAEQMTAALSSQLVGGGLVLMFTGSVIALCRSLPNRIWQTLALRTTSVVEIKNTDPLFDYVTFWIDGQERFSKARYLHATTENRIAAARAGNNSRVMMPGEIGDGAPTVPTVFFSPSRGQHYLMREGRWLRIERSSRTTPDGPSSNEQGRGKSPERESFMFTGFGKSQAVLKRLINEIVVYGSRPVDGTRVYYSTFNYWQCSGRKKMRALSSVILPDGVVSGLVADAVKFLAAEEWYRETGIPWHRGYLFHGVPGSGKTSLAAALAGELHLDLHLLNIGGSGMNDERLSSLMAEIRPGSMIVMEDIDCTVPDRDANEANRVTLSGLLNCLDGIMSREGCMIVMTTNFRERLDPALIRPGRVDKELEFGYASSGQKMRLAARLGGAVPSGEALTMAECQQKILSGLEERQPSGQQCNCPSETYEDVGPVCPICSGARWTSSVPAEPVRMIYRFKRFRNGKEMAEGAVVTKASNGTEALERARRMFADCPYDTFRLESAEPAEAAQ